MKEKNGFAEVKYAVVSGEAAADAVAMHSALLDAPSPFEQKLLLVEPQILELCPIR